MNVNIHLMKRHDSDLIAFFNMQDKSASSLILKALMCYIHDESINENLRNTVLVKADRNVQVLVRINDQQVCDYIKNLPNGFKAPVIKNIVRTMYSGALYGHQHETNNKIQLPENFSERIEEIKEEQHLTSAEPAMPSAESNDLLDIFNQMLG